LDDLLSGLTSRSAKINNQNEAKTFTLAKKGRSSSSLLLFGGKNFRTNKTQNIGRNIIFDARQDSRKSRKC
jgi:hypothetical protein